MTTSALLAPSESVESGSTTPVALRHHRVFLASVAAVMLHVVDDNYLQPNPGVSPADHLVSGIVPLALLGLGAWAYPRLRAGNRALVASGVGLTGLVVGLVEPVSHWGNVGLRNDDYSGVLAALAGLLLLGMSAVTLWRSRRLDDSRTRRYVRRAVKAVVAAVVMFEIVVIFSFSYAVTHVSRAEVQIPHLGTAHENVTLTTSDGLHLKGWYVPSRNGAAVIAFPGRQGPQAHARMLAKNGYGVLLFDRRGEGESDGDGNLLGWGGARDIDAAVDFLKKRSDVDPGRIGGIGFSVGGELMLEAAAGNPDIAAVVSEGAGTRVLREQVHEFNGFALVRSFHQMVTIDAGTALFSNTAPPTSLVELAPRIAPRPALVIWAPNGGNRETMSTVYADRIGPSAEVWAMDDVNHIKGLQTHPEEYERRVVGFFDRALPAG
ncbi:alpha/beta fold hydrolase [Aeromicrobium sp. NPDC092404]|uniref:alpha/beta hydrolase n=1 Tax=Aeromicrobium sp. NPDC092404 TaxID=3154976 RepID=UPI00342DE963